MIDSLNRGVRPVRNDDAAAGQQVNAQQKSQAGTDGRVFYGINGDRKLVHSVRLQLEFPASRKNYWGHAAVRADCGADPHVPCNHVHAKMFKDVHAMYHVHVHAKMLEAL